MGSCSDVELPPRFEAEMSGSECSDTALELHKEQFGVLSQDSPRDSTAAGETGAKTLAEGGSMVPVAGRTEAVQQANKQESDDCYKVKGNLIVEDAPRVSIEEQAKSPTIDVGVDRRLGKTICCVFC